MNEKQKLIGVDSHTKELIDSKFKEKGYTTRAKYIKALVDKDNPTIINDVNPENLG